MSAKTNTEAKVPVLKGQEVGARLPAAEDKVLEYIKRMNRPFGAVDVAANLKGAVPKTATQKILVTLAEKGELVQKTYGKTTFFVANQANLEDMPAEKLKTLEIEYKAVEETNKALLADVKAASAELAKLKSTPTDAEICSQMDETTAMIAKAIAHLEPLRSGSPLVSAEELAQLDAEWLKWRAEWIRRRKIFNENILAVSNLIARVQPRTFGERLLISQVPVAANRSLNTFAQRRLLSSHSRRENEAGLEAETSSAPSVTGELPQIFVRNLPFSVDNEQLAELFKSCGPISWAATRTGADGRPAGYGHVMFESVESVQAALKMDGYELGGRAVYVSQARGQPKTVEPVSPSSTVFVNNVPFDATVEDLEETFGQFGEITVRAPQNDEGGMKGYAFVEFSDIETAQRVIDELNGKEFLGRELRLQFGKPRGGGGEGSRRGVGFGGGRGREGSFGRDQGGGSFGKRGGGYGGGEDRGGYGGGRGGYEGSGGYSRGGGGGGGGYRSGGRGGYGQRDGGGGGYGIRDGGD
ncbi:hypothetical protein EW026_g5251 [Hermanssonia centrifuga]|uniref:RRM domain-containing protein n=1 Tax=Hermanssonia centrifuga TaxID=98765 RepID=A0A4S4KFM4_9APHY|nr:hypothetical protein EW026_g5251 [Hermanssonia centrifuga]